MATMRRRRPNLYGHLYGCKVRPRWWSFLNWIQGYRWGAVQRYRCCGHTTPFHYAECDRRP